MQRSAADWLAAWVKVPYPGTAQLALEMRDHLGISSADAGCVVNVFFVPLQPVGHVACLGAFIQRRVKLLVGQGQLALGPVLRHRPAPVVEQRLTAFRPEHHRLNRRPLPRRLAKRGLHERRQIGDAHQHNPADALGQNRLGRGSALGIVCIAQAHLGQ